MSDPDQQLTEVRALAARLLRAQTAQKLKDNAFVARFRDNKNNLLLGSQRTWERMREEDWAALNPAKWLPRLRQAAAQLDGGSPLAEIFEDLPFYKTGAAHVARLEGQNTDRRCLMALATTGCGKSILARALVDEQRGQRIYHRVRPSLRNQGGKICAALYQRVTGEDLGNLGYDDALKKLTPLLEANPLTIFFDEAHDGGVALMKIIKHLIDETSSRFVYLAYPTEYSAVISASSGALTEARQFVGRCMKPIFDDYRDGTKQKDVEIVLRKSDVADPGPLAARLTPVIKVREGLRTLVDAIEYGRLKFPDADLDGTIMFQALEAVTGQKIKTTEEA